MTRKESETSNAFIEVPNNWPTPKAGESQFSYDARELHRFLEVKTPFGHWFYREARRCNLKEGEDFVRCTTPHGELVATPGAKKRGSRERKDYLLTFRAMQHLSLICNTAMGEAFREAPYSILDRYMAV